MSGRFAILNLSSKRKGKEMRGLPDSAVVGTYKRVKRIGKSRKATAKQCQREADLLNSMITSLFVYAVKGVVNLTKKD
jgi:hypothetical protein